MCQAIRCLRRWALSPEDGIVIRRNISSAGKSRAYINDSLVNIQSLSAIGKNSLTCTGSMNTKACFQRIIREPFWIFTANSTTKGQKSRRCSMKFSRSKELGKLKENVKERMQRIDLLSFQINEIDSASLKKGGKGSAGRREGHTFKPE